MNKQSDLFDLPGAKKARDAGMAKAAFKSQDWIGTGLLRIASLPHGFEGIGEEICGICRLGPPPSPGAVGALIMHARRQGLLAATGRMQKPRCVKSHARATYIWRRT